jgi:hypothetical protein
MTQTKQPPRRIAYIATIRREGDEYVARDDSGSKRAWGKVCSNLMPSFQNVATYLFHQEEIGNVWHGHGVICAEILDFSKPSESPVAETCEVTIAIESTADELRTRIKTLDKARSAACYDNPLLAHCLERVIGDLRKAANELATLAELTKGGE